MNAFYSGTDNNNDKSGIYYSGVIGKLTDTSYEHVLRFNLYEQKKICKLEEVFEITEKVVEVPKSWLDKVENAPTRYIGYQGQSKGLGFGLDRNPATGLPSLFDNQSMIGHPIVDFEEVSVEEVRKSQSKGNGGKIGKAGKKPVDWEDPMTWEVPGPLDLQDSNSIDIEDDPLGYGAKYGGEALEAYNLIDDFLINLEECDDALKDIITQCYNMLTSEGQMYIATNGLR